MKARYVSSAAALCAALGCEPMEAHPAEPAPASAPATASAPAAAPAPASAPVPAPAPAPAAASAPDLDPAAQAILTFLRKALAPQSKADILAETRLPEAAWKPAIDHLKTAGLVDTTGAARGTRYSLRRR